MPRAPEVDAWFDEYEHPAKDAMLLVREIILSDERMSETMSRGSRGRVVRFAVTGVPTG